MQVGIMRHETLLSRRRFGRRIGACTGDIYGVDHGCLVLDNTVHDPGRIARNLHRAFLLPALDKNEVAIIAASVHYAAGRSGFFAQEIALKRSQTGFIGNQGSDRGAEIALLEILVEHL